MTKRRQLALQNIGLLLRQVDWQLHMSQLEDQPARWIELPLHRMISQAQRDWSALSASSDVKEASTTVQIGEDPAPQESDVLFINNNGDGLWNDVKSSSTCTNQLRQSRTVHLNPAHGSSVTCETPSSSVQVYQLSRYQSSMQSACKTTQYLLSDWRKNSGKFGNMGEGILDELPTTQ